VVAIPRAAGNDTTNHAKSNHHVEARWHNRPDAAQSCFAVITLTVAHDADLRADADRHGAPTARLTLAQRHDPARTPRPLDDLDTPVVRRDGTQDDDMVTAMDDPVADLLTPPDDDGLDAAIAASTGS
jgi:hypothetical protein